MSEFDAIANEAMFAADAYEYLPLDETKGLPRIQLWRDKRKQPSGIIMSARIKRDEYIQIDPRNGRAFGTGQINE